MRGGTPIDFFLQGTRGAYASCAAKTEGWQAVSVSCPACGLRYIAGVERRDPAHDAAAVLAYPDVAGQILLARRTLGSDCPDHAYRIRVRPFSIVA